MQETIKTVAVFGANGRVGSLVVNELVSRGYAVRAFVHSSKKLGDTKDVQFIQGDIGDVTKVQEALIGADAVLSALGSWGTKQKNILTMGMKVIVPQMEKKGLQRLISLTGADAWTGAQMEDFRLKRRLFFGTYNHRPAVLQAFAHRIFSTLAGKIVEDGENHMKLLESSSLDWTVIRSPVMNNRGESEFELTNTYPWPWATINRTGVAISMVDQIENTNYVRQAPYIGRS